MTCRLFVSLVFSTALAFGDEHMTVAVCNVGQLPEHLIDQAETEAAHVFRIMGVEIHWTACQVDAENAGARRDFLVRVRVGGQIKKTGNTSLGTMGRAFMNVGGAGNMVDVYYGAIQLLTTRYPIVSVDQVLGYTIVHELGHLLIGAGHRPYGIMRAAWSKDELEAIDQGRLKFNSAERKAILRTLRSR